MLVKEIIIVVVFRFDWEWDRTTYQIPKRKTDDLLRHKLKKNITLTFKIVQQDWSGEQWYLRYLWQCLWIPAVSLLCSLLRPANSCTRRGNGMAPANLLSFNKKKSLSCTHSHRYESYHNQKRPAELKITLLSDFCS